MKKTFILFFLVCICISCSTAPAEILEARIFERKLLSNGTMMVYYVCTRDGLIIKDSAAVKYDTVIEDMVKVKYSSNASKKTSILLP